MNQSEAVNVLHKQCGFKHYHIGNISAFLFKGKCFLYVFNTDKHGREIIGEVSYGKTPERFAEAVKNLIATELL